MAAERLSEAKLLLLALYVLAIILVSGCTTGNTVSGNGVTVKEFMPEFSEIYSKEPVTFRLLMKNEGSVDAKNVHAELLGLDEDWCSPAATSCEQSTGDRMERLPNEEECSYKDKKGFDMLAPDPQRGTSGSSHICTWTYTAPPIQKGFTITYSPTARVFYTYTSGVIKLITFGSSRELRTIQDTKGKLPIETKSQTNSPIMLDIQTQGPIRFWAGENRITFPLEITINNVGGGVACAFTQSNDMKDACKGTTSDALKKDLKNQVRVIIDFGETSGDIMKISDECKDFMGYGKTVSLWKGQSNSIVCEVEASGLSSEVEATTQRMVRAQAIYEYYTDTSSSIKVIGKETGDKSFF